MESIKDSLSAMSELFNTKMSEFQHELQKTSSSVATHTPSLSTEFTQFRSFIITALSTLQRQVEFLGRELDRQEMQSRRKILLLHGVPEEKAENTSARVTSLVADHLDLTNFSSSSIKTSYRLGKSTANRNRPIVVKFCDVSVRDKVWFAKSKFKGTGITQSEFLTKTRHDVFLLARQRFGIGKCWTRDGRIFFVAPDGSRHQVESHAELEAVSSSLLKSPEVKGSNVSKNPDSKVTVSRPKRIIKK
ncbi:uncharacterized protein LOC125077012 [Vanessa atalanta]|uniref:uncharacterized protein LOC125075696 n=1 Tax=Vanessa atalanta TaxID=42275 RepID=UPI001FCDC06A|nr:uncharacterized protein LOC125075696 [Vanessa atalanta]XP_047544741.1 uncharacterized protein LOC125077012 [Vanessa atalanta]